MTTNLPAPPAPPAPPMPPVDVTGSDGAHTTIEAIDGKTVITKTSPEGVTKTVTVEGMPPMAIMDEAPGHNFGVSSWVLVVALVLVAGLVRTWIRAKHGDTRTNWERRRGVPPAGAGTTREAELLAAENERLRGQVGRLEERIAVLERIVTDPAKRVADEIEALRR